MVRQKLAKNGPFGVRRGRRNPRDNLYCVSREERKGRAKRAQKGSCALLAAYGELQVTTEGSGPKRRGEGDPTQSGEEL